MFMICMMCPLAFPCLEMGRFPCWISCKVGVFDGHGPYGHQIANFVQEHLPREFLQSEHFKQNDVEKALKDAFAATQKKCPVVKINNNMTCTCECIHSHFTVLMFLGSWDIQIESKVWNAKKSGVLTALWAARRRPWHMFGKMWCSLVEEILQHPPMFGLKRLSGELWCF